MAETPTGTIGVGVVYNGALAEPLAAGPGLVDIVSLIPEMLWHETAERPRYRRIDAAAKLFDAAVAGADTPVVLHGVGLSIGSDLPLDVEHLDQVAEVADHYGARWYGEHLAAFRVATAASRPMHAGMSLPLPFDSQTLRRLAPKVASVVNRMGMPFLLENSAIFVPVPDEEMTEAGFLNRLGAEAGAGVLLDLHNLYANEINLGWDADDYLAELDLTLVKEVHVAGGEFLGRWYTDAHSGACPERVWRLLDGVARDAPNLELVTFEMHESRYDVLGEDGLRRQLDRIRQEIGSRAEVAHVA